MLSVPLTGQPCARIPTDARYSRMSPGTVRHALIELIFDPGAPVEMSYHPSMTTGSNDMKLSSISGYLADTSAYVRWVRRRQYRYRSRNQGCSEDHRAYTYAVPLPKFAFQLPSPAI